MSNASDWEKGMGLHTNKDGELINGMHRLEAVKMMRAEVDPEEVARQKREDQIKFICDRFKKLWLSKPQTEFRHLIWINNFDDFDDNTIEKQLQ